MFSILFPLFTFFYRVPFRRVSCPISRTSFLGTIYLFSKITSRFIFCWRHFRRIWRRLAVFPCSWRRFLGFSRRFMVFAEVTQINDYYKWFCQGAPVRLGAK